MGCVGGVSFQLSQFTVNTQYIAYFEALLGPDIRRRLTSQNFYFLRHSSPLKSLLLPNPEIL